MVPAQAYVGEFLETFKEFPPSRKPEKWDLSEIMERIQAKPGNK